MFTKKLCFVKLQCQAQEALKAAVALPEAAMMEVVVPEAPLWEAAMVTTLRPQVEALLRQTIQDKNERKTL